MGERYEMKMYDGSDPDAPMSFWEGWPLTALAIAYSSLYWGMTGLMIWKGVSSLFG